MFRNAIFVVNLLSITISVNCYKFRVILLLLLADYLTAVVVVVVVMGTLFIFIIFSLSS